MEILKITKADIDKDGYYKEPSVDFDGRIEIDANLGWVRFKKFVRAKSSIIAKAGSGIEAGEGIEAGWGIEGKTIASKLRIFAGLCIWRMPTAEEKQIRAKLIEGEIAYGELVEPADDVPEADEPVQPLSADEISAVRKLLAEAS